jgi:hypothetical protein
MKRRDLHPIAVVAALALVAACSKPSDTIDAKRSPKPPPAASVAVPAGLHVDVEIDGVPAPPIDAARLGATAPDFQDEDHRAWRVATLVGPAAARPGVVVAAVGDKGVAVEMRAGAGPTDPTPVLSLTRRGDVVAELLAPETPFPDFHGKGGRLNRPGDPTARVPSPVRLRVYVAGSTAPAPSTTVGTGTGGGAGDGGGALAATNAAPLEVVVTGTGPTTWTPDALAAQPRFTIHADGADKDAWSLRDLAHALVGPHARVTGATDGGGTKAKIAKKDWADPKKTPVLRINRRGMYKIEWVDKDGSLTPNDEDVRDVRSVEVSPGG